MPGGRKQQGIIFHPVLGYAIPPPVPLAVQRRNARERTRVKTVNQSYESLKAHVPSAARHKRMSKVEIIKHALDYIERLQRMVEQAEETEEEAGLELNSSSADPGSVLHPSQECDTTITAASYSPGSDSGYSSPDCPASCFPFSAPCPSQPCNQFQQATVLTDSQVLDAIVQWQDS